MKVWDLHCDTLYELRRAEKAGAPKSFLHNDLHIDLEKLQQGDYLLQCFAAYVDLADPAPGADPLVSVLEEIDIFKRLMAAYPEKIAPVYTAADLERNRAEGKLSAMLTVEEGGCCKGSLGVLRRLQELGVRMMTLTWNYPNELAAPNANPGGPLVANTETGLTEQGFAFLEEMEKLHITADVSHLSDKGFWDIANHSTRPFAASHSNCRALSPHNRNLTDEMIRALAEKGGIAGLNYCASFVDADSAHPKLCRSTVERLDFKQVAGISHDPGPGAGLRREAVAGLSRPQNTAKTKAEHPPSGRCSAFSGFVQAMQPMLRSKNSQKVRLNALNRVVVTHTASKHALVAHLLCHNIAAWRGNAAQHHQQGHQFSSVKPRCTAAGGTAPAGPST